MNERPILWKLLFGAIVIGYCLYYAPFGINETDGGFLTGLAWQVLNGKLLYQDILYVRPPLPVWLRALELQVLPEHLAILGERWFFYLKIALYSYLGAAILAPGAQRWPLAVMGFVLSAHAYPAMAWHTVDGILFGVLAAFWASRTSAFHFVLAGASLCASLLCKQSFYPLLLFFPLILSLEKENRWKRLSWFFTGLMLSAGWFFYHLSQNHTLQNFFEMTSGAASGGQAVQHGLLDYFRISPVLALPSIALLALVAWWSWNDKSPQKILRAWQLWLVFLVLSYVVMTWMRQLHTVPFAQSRMLFWVAVAWITTLLYRWKFKRASSVSAFLQPLLLLSITWCAAVSWGYNLPILFSTPWVWAAMELTRKLASASKPPQHSNSYNLGYLFLLLAAFRIGYEFVYRDGRRTEMTTSMGEIFPSLSGIYSDPESAVLYRELKQLREQYGPNFKVLPAFPQANFLTQTPPVLPLDWVVNRETNRDNSLVIKTLMDKKPFVFIQKSFQEKIENDPELELTRKILKQGTILQETPNFWVVQHYTL